MRRIAIAFVLCSALSGAAKADLLDGLIFGIKCAGADDTEECEARSKREADESRERLRQSAGAPDSTGPSALSSNRGERADQCHTVKASRNADIDVAYVRGKSRFGFTTLDEKKHQTKGGYSLDPEEKAKMAAETANKLAARADEQDRLHKATAQRVSKQMDSLVPASELTPYMRDKGIQAHAGALTDKDGQKTYIPAFDVDGKQWTMQYIQEDGTKRFAKDSKKEGCFHPVGSMNALAKAPALVISEGYATAATNAEVLGFATVAAFDSGNLPAVARALHDKFPDKPIVIAGDDDRHLEATQGINPGRTKAEQAAKAVGGKAMFPIFGPGEQSANPKGFTDFNDLATKSELGKEEVERQVRAEVGRVIRDAKEKRERVQEQVKQVQEERPKRASRIA